MNAIKTLASARASLKQKIRWVKERANKEENPESVKEYARMKLIDYRCDLIDIQEAIKLLEGQAL